VLKQIAALLLAITSLSVSARADWSDASRQWEHDFQNSPVLFPDAHMAEVWTTARDQSVRDAHIHIHSVKDSRFETGSFKVSLQTKRNWWFHVRKAPLMLYLPGLFADMEGHESMRAAAFFSERGYHVVIPSNPWSQEFLKHRPRFDPGTIDVEAQVMLSALQFAIKQIGAQYISRVEISGESYGAMLATIAYAQDQQSASPLIDGNATFFSPPLDMTVAIDNLDSGIDANQSFFDSCSGAGTLLKADNECVDHTAEDQMSQDVIQCASPLVYGSFHGDLVNSLELFHSFRRTGFIPTDKAALKEWALELRFKSLLSDYLPNSQTLLGSGKGSLLYWLDELDANSIRKVRIFTAKDDFLNTGLDWPIGHSIIRYQNFMEIPWSGHAGYMELSDFQDLLNTAFIASEL
jgi:hypothetical protein